MEGLSNMPMPKKKFISEHFQPYANMSASINGLSVLKKNIIRKKKYGINAAHLCTMSYIFYERS